MRKILYITFITFFIFIFGFFPFLNINNNAATKKGVDIFDINVLAASNFSSGGYYGQYYNIIKSETPYFTHKPKELKGPDTGWYDDEYLSFARVDDNLAFGKNFYPVNEGLPGDPKYFTVHWSAYLEAGADADYKYKIGADDDAWVLIDGEYTSNLGGIHYTVWDEKQVFLSAGTHTLDIYFANRSVSGSHMFFYIDERIRVSPRIDASSGSYANMSGTNTGGSGSDSSGAGSSASGLRGGPVVAGSEHSYYTPATALLKTPESPDVYAIMNGQRHYISSPASFNEYGYNWKDIKTVSREKLDKYPRARLIKHPEEATIYYLYQRPELKWLKIILNSPTVFVSYPQNYWGNVININKYDIDSYPFVEFIRNPSGGDIYYLSGNKKHYIADSIFLEKGFNPHKIVTVNQIHFDSYKTEGDFK